MQLPTSMTGWLFTIIGAFAVIVALGLARRTLGLLSGGRAEGVVVGSERTSGAAGRDESTGVRMFYRPKVRFATADGRTLTFTSTAGHAKPLADGTRVSVRYDRRNPEDAEVATFASLWVFPLACLVVGVTLLLIGLSVVKTG